MEAQASVDLASVVIAVPLLHVITASIALISFGWGVAWLAFRVQRSVKSNISQNNLNHQVQLEILKNQHEQQMKAFARHDKLLEQIICYTRLQLRATTDPDFKYNPFEGECEDKG